MIEEANIKIQPVLSKEQMDFDEALKHVKHVGAILKISQEGVDMQNVLQDNIENAISLLDQMETIQRNFNIDAQKIQLDANNKAKVLQEDSNNKMKVLQEDANKKFGEVQNNYRELINSMKGVTNGDNEYDIKNATILTKEREEQIQKELAMLASQKLEKNA